LAEVIGGEVAPQADDDLDAQDGLADAYQRVRARKKRWMWRGAWLALATVCWGVAAVGYVAMHPTGAATFTRTTGAADAALDAWLLVPLPVRNASAAAEAKALRGTAQYVYQQSLYGMAYDVVSCGRAYDRLASDVALSPTWTDTNRADQMAHLGDDETTVKTLDGTIATDIATAISQGQ
jgi:hypothetical protein